jgi:hypothetical protein
MLNLHVLAFFIGCYEYFVENDLWRFISDVILYFIWE